MGVFCGIRHDSACACRKDGLGDGTPAEILQHLNTCRLKALDRAFPAALVNDLLSGRHDNGNIRVAMLVVQGIRKRAAFLQGGMWTADGDKLGPMYFLAPEARYVREGLD